jgi:hypothetical protein
MSGAELSTTETAGEPLPADEPGERRAGWLASPRVQWLASTWVRWTAGYALAGVVLYLCYLWLSRTQPVISDGASNTLEAWDMLHGNLLLRGWTLSDVSFYVTELPEYMIVELVRGLGPDVMHVAAAFTYTVLVLLAGIVAKGRTTGREAAVRIVLASGLMLAPSLGVSVRLLLGQSDHIGTGVPLLLTFLVLDRAPRRWWVPPLIGLMLSWAVIGDRVSILVAVVPLVAVCALHAYQDRDRWFAAAIGVAALVSLGVASVVVHEITSHGGFTMLPLSTQFASTPALSGNFWLTVEGVLALYGADFFGMPLHATAGFVLIHLAGVALATWGVCRGVRRFGRLNLLEQVLTVAIVANIAAYLFSSMPVTAWDSRQMAAILPFGAVLAARLLSADLLRLRLVAPLTAVLACYLAALGYGVAQPAVAAHGQDLADWLVAHHLTGGISAYDEGNILTLDSKDKVQVRVVSWQPGGPVPRHYQSKASWFDPRTNYANFVLVTKVDGLPQVIPRREIVAAFGPPVTTYQYGSYTIMVWNKNLLAELHGPPSASPGDIGIKSHGDLWDNSGMRETGTIREVAMTGG